MSEHSERQLATIKGVGYTLGAIVILIIGWAWYVNNHYSFVYDNNFMKSCIAEGGTEVTCGCALDIMKENYSFRQAKAIETSGVLPAKLTNSVASNCF